MRIGIGKDAAEQHLVRAQTDARYQVVWFECCLLDLSVEIGRVTIKRQPANLMQRVVTMRPHFRKVKRVEPIGLGVLERHDLHFECPTRIVTTLNRVEEIALVVIGVLAGNSVRLRLREKLDALVGLEVVLHPEALASRVYPHVRMAGEAIHFPPALKDAAVTHQPRNLMSRLRRQRPEVPLHIVVAQAAISTSLLRTNEVLELHWIA